jgi:tetratricopeptide (TPR) repeat protein
MKKPGKTNESQAGVPHEPPTNARSHTECFASGMKHFSAGDYSAALDVFEAASDGPELSINESARMYARICQQKLDRQRLETASPEERYSIGVDLLGQGRFTEAIACLESALKAGETAPVRYALALAAGNIGDIATAVKHFRRACELDPSIRATARSDAAFRTLLQFSELREVVSDRG